MQRSLPTTLLTIAALGTGLALLAFASTALAASTLFGGATQSGGAVTLVSSPTQPFSGVAFDDATGQTVADLSSLSTDYNVTDDDCAAGSPRFQIGVDTTGDSVRDGNVFVYIGPTPDFTGCGTGWQSTGELVGSTDARFDLSQFGGPFYGTYADMIALLGDDTITGVSLVVDSGWAFGDGEQTVLVDNVHVDGGVYTFTSKDDCKNGGWQSLGFKNQGQCVRSVSSNR